MNDGGGSRGAADRRWTTLAGPFETSTGDVVTLAGSRDDLAAFGGAFGGMLSRDAGIDAWARMIGDGECQAYATTRAGAPTSTGELRAWGGALRMVPRRHLCDAGDGPRTRRAVAEFLEAVATGSITARMDVVGGRLVPREGAGVDRTDVGTGTLRRTGGPVAARVWVMSDLHLETLADPDAFKPVPGPFDVMAFAGDAWSRRPVEGIAAVRRIAGEAPVVMVAGNHECWGSTTTEAMAAMRRAAVDRGVTLLEDGEAVVAGIRFLGSTLWTDYRLGPAMPAGSATGDAVDVADEDGFRPFRIADAVGIHARSRAFLEGAAATDDGSPTVVMTHFAPHPLCVAPRMRGTFGAANAASDLSALTDAAWASLWIHGHVHHSVRLVRPGGTRILCNPAGARASNPDFDPRLVVEVRERGGSRGSGT